MSRTVHRRILSLWFPRLGAEQLLRHARHLTEAPFAVVEDRQGMQVLCSLSEAASRAGLREGQPLRDAHAMCAALVTRARNVQSEAAFLTTLRRWAGKFSPWVAEEPPAGLIVDLTGCAHLFGGEAALLEQMALDCDDLGLTMRPGIADTPGAAWALARFAGSAAQMTARSGDAIDQEAWATRSRAARRPRWEREAPVVPPPGQPLRIAPPGRTRAALAPLPIAALRLPAETVEQLARLGLRRIDELVGQPRAGSRAPLRPVAGTAPRPGDGGRAGAGLARRPRPAFRGAPDPARADRPRGGHRSPRSTGCCRGWPNCCAPRGRARAGCGSNATAPTTRWGGSRSDWPAPRPSRSGSGRCWR